jgi:hypothetical protein
MKKIIILIIIALIVIQFFRPKRNISETPAQYAITQVPADVEEVFKTSCYDCHSNNTAYPWYNNIQPVAWWLDKHVKDGKRHLNFDIFDSVTTARKIKKLKNISSTIKKDEMPLSSYTLIHRNAILNQQQKDLVIHWADSLVAELSKN